jgi:hypothetical protein
MKRRSFVKASLLTPSIPAMLKGKHSNDENAKPGRLFYELRIYTLGKPEQEAIIAGYYQKTAIPAYNRLGSSPIGIFKTLKPDDQQKIFVLIPYDSTAAFAAMPARLREDALYKKAGGAYLEATAEAPAYDRIESSLLQAFQTFPRIVVPAKKSRIFELRRYESPTEAAGQLKIDMFDNKGEISIFKRTGLTPVFFGETLIGPLRPNLIYMLTFDDMAAHDSHWKTFGNDDEWKKIKSVPEYADAKIISHITSTFLAPLEFSQV